MSGIKIHPLSEKPEYSDVCAAWSFAQWGCYIQNENLKNMINKYKVRTKNKDTLPLVWVAEYNGRVSGMIALKEEDGHPKEMGHLRPWLTALFVHPLYRNKGIAGTLINTLAKEAKNLGFEKLYLTTPDAEYLYEKHGFQTIDTISDKRGYTDHAQLMMKALQDV